MRVITLSDNKHPKIANIIWHTPGKLYITVESESLAAGM